MARFREVRRETRDGGKIRQDENKNNSRRQIDSVLLEELSRVGFDDDFEIAQEKIKFRLDQKGNPILPEGWTFLTHGSSLEKWDASLLGNDFVVGNGIVNGHVVSGRPLCCVERSVAKFDYERSGRNTAKDYGGQEQFFEVRVLFYKNPRLGDGKTVRDKLSQNEIKEISEYYMYQGGRHPAVPTGTKLVFVKSADFDEITNTNGNNIFWYIPEKYLQQYLDDVQEIENIDINEQFVTQDAEISQEDDRDKKPLITNEDVEKKLTEYWTEDIPADTIKVYLNDKFSQIYRERLDITGIDIEKFLEGQKLKLEYFEGVETYKEIIEELESLLDFTESMLEEKKEVQEDVNAITHDEITEETQTAQVSFEQMLINEGFASVGVQGIKSTIKSVNPRILVDMDKILSKTKEQTLARGGIDENGNEQDYR